MALVDVLTTDSFDQFRTKTNAAIDGINNLTITGAALSLSSLANAQSLVYNGASFVNVTLSGAATIDNNGVVTITNGTTGLIPKGRLKFASGSKLLY